MPTHRRQDSGEEPIPSEPAPDSRNQPSESDSQNLTPPPQDLPRGSRERARVVRASEGLSRNPSTCSTSSNAKSHEEYLTTQARGSDRAPSSATRSPIALANPPLEPPVTRMTLSELDVQKIVHNPKLRHDINFDPELHFRPNLDGEKGRRKQEKANLFWTTLHQQLTLFAMDRDAFYASCGSDGNWCLPSLLRAVRDIIETLVPHRDRELLNEGLNVDLLMQQFNRGVADLEKLASWLAGVLKLHCAPMRDEWVDEMYRELSEGNRNNNMEELVKGMRSLLGVLEAMKLDVANHQIRCLRPVLIEDTVHFEQRYFIKKIESKKLSIAPARIWYRSAQDYVRQLYAGSPMPHLHAFGEMAVFFEALSRLILPSTSHKTTPSTFYFDEDRILKLRSDVHDSICLEICMRKYEELERLSRVTQLCSRVPSYASDQASVGSRSSGEFNFMAPSTSRPSSIALSDRSSDFSSPRTSGAYFAQPSADATDSRSKAAELYNSLVALLHTVHPGGNPAERWRSLAGPMALQILRYANAPMSLPGFEDRLAAWLDDVHGDVFREVEAHFHQRLMVELARRVSELKNLSGVALFSVATGGRAMGHGRPWDHRARDQSQRGAILCGNVAPPRDPREDGGVEDIALRLAHLGILHWRVWGPLAYEGDVESELNAQATHNPAL